MLEYWMKDKEIIKRVSKHYKTGQQMPEDMLDDLLEKLDDSNNIMRTLFQLLMGSFDFMAYTINDKKLLNQAVKLNQNYSLNTVRK